MTELALTCPHCGKPASAAGDRRAACGKEIGPAAAKRVVLNKALHVHGTLHIQGGSTLVIQRKK